MAPLPVRLLAAMAMAALALPIRAEQAVPACFHLPGAFRMAGGKCLNGNTAIPGSTANRAAFMADCTNTGTLVTWDSTIAAGMNRLAVQLPGGWFRPQIRASGGIRYPEGNPLAAGVAVGGAAQRAACLDIGGHTDAVGPVSDNFALSERRAIALAEKLIRNYGIRVGLFITAGYGKSVLLIPTSGEEWRNLRVTLRRIDQMVGS